MPSCTTNRVTLLAAAALATTIFSSGCNNASAPEAVQNLGIGRPTITVDAAHSQLKNNPENKYQIYQMAPGREFNLDMGSYKLEEMPQYAGKPKIVSVVAGPGKTFSCPYDENKKTYLISPSFYFEKKDNVLVGVGYSIEGANGAPAFVPVWVGIVNIQ